MHISVLKPVMAMSEFCTPGYFDDYLSLGDITERPKAQATSGIKHLSILKNKNPSKQRSLSR